MRSIWKFAPLGPTGGRFCSKVTHVAVGRIQSLAGWWMKGLRFPLTVAWRPSSVSASIMAVGSHPRVQERASKTVFCNQILAVTSHHICHILLVERDSLGPAHPQGDRIRPEHEYPGGYFRGCPPPTLFVSVRAIWFYGLGRPRLRANSNVICYGCTKQNLGQKKDIRGNLRKSE